MTEAEGVAESDAEGMRSREKAKPKHQVLRFVALFALFELLFYWFWMSEPFEKGLLPPYIRALAVSSAAVLGAFGEAVQVHGVSFVGRNFSMVVSRGCDGLEALALFWSAVLAFPARVSKKMFGLLAGSVLLLAVNCLRLITLYCAGSYAPDIFEPLHLVVWPAIIIFAAVALWMVWARPGVSTL